MPVKFQPDGYSAVTPYLICKNAAAAIEFYKQAFGAAGTVAMNGPDGRIMHAEIKIGGQHPKIVTQKNIANFRRQIDSIGFSYDWSREINTTDPAERAVATQFYGDRTGGILDPFGHRWYLATHVEDVSPEEMKSRMQAAQ